MITNSGPLDSSLSSSSGPLITFMQESSRLLFAGILLKLADLPCPRITGEAGAITFFGGGARYGL